MAPQHNVSTSSGPRKYQLTAAERRDARLAEIAGKQSELKREAAERRAKREVQSAEGGPTPTKGRAA